MYRTCYKKPALKRNYIEFKGIEKENHLLIDGSFSSTNFTHNKLFDNSDKVDIKSNSNISEKKDRKKFKMIFEKKK